MAFTGVFEAPLIQPSAFGLLAVVKPQNAPDEDKWVRGFSQEWETTTQYLSNWDATDTTQETIVNGDTVKYYTEINPFFVEIDETLSTLSFLSVDRIQRITRQLDGMTQKAMEVELWDGEIRKDESHPNAALSGGSATVLNSGTALSAKRAVALLEHEIGQYSHSGEQGFIHMSRDVFSILSSAGQVFMHTRDGSGDHLQTSGGTPVIVGSGYSGNGPDGASGAEATADNKWIYATGTVKTFVGKVDVVNDNLAQAYDVSGNQNDMRLKAIRPVAAYFDTSIHLAIRVNLTA
jgi:hypothetical protein